MHGTLSLTHGFSQILNVYWKVFHTNLLYGGDVKNISFVERPVLATSLQIRPLNWTQDYPCMRIELYGCLYDMSESYDLMIVSKVNTQLLGPVK